MIFVLWLLILVLLFPGFVFVPLSKLSLHLHSRPSVKHVLGVLDWFWMVSDKNTFQMSKKVLSLPSLTPSPSAGPYFSTFCAPFPSYNTSVFCNFTIAHFRQFDLCQSKLSAICLIFKDQLSLHLTNARYFLCSSSLRSWFICIKCVENWPIWWFWWFSSDLWGSQVKRQAAWVLTYFGRGSIQR